MEQEMISDTIVVEMRKLLWKMVAHERVEKYDYNYRSVLRDTIPKLFNIVKKYGGCKYCLLEEPIVYDHMEHVFPVSGKFFPSVTTSAYRGTLCLSNNGIPVTGVYVKECVMCGHRFTAVNEREEENIE